MTVQDHPEHQADPDRDHQVERAIRRMCEQLAADQRTDPGQRRERQEAQHGAAEAQRRDQRRREDEALRDAMQDERGAERPSGRGGDPALERHRQRGAVEKRVDREHRQQDRGAQPRGARVGARLDHHERGKADRHGGDRQRPGLVDQVRDQAEQQHRQDDAEHRGIERRQGSAMIACPRGEQRPEQQPGDRERQR
jgi:hypothetical protein